VQLLSKDEFDKQKEKHIAHAALGGAVSIILNLSYG
jgi:hypothetical protein